MNPFKHRDHAQVIEVDFNAMAQTPSEARASERTRRIQDGNKASHAAWMKELKQRQEESAHAAKRRKQEADAFQAILDAQQKPGLLTRAARIIWNQIRDDR